MEAGVVEEVALDAPDLAVHLRPLRRGSTSPPGQRCGAASRRRHRAWARADRHRSRAAAGAGPDHPARGSPCLAVEHLLAVAGDPEEAHALSGVSARRFRRSKRCTVVPAPGVPGAGRGVFERQKRARLAGLKRDVAARRHRQRQDALVDVVDSRSSPRARLRLRRPPCLDGRPGASGRLRPAPAGPSAPPPRRSRAPAATGRPCRARRVDAAGGVARHGLDVRRSEARSVVAVKYRYLPPLSQTAIAGVAHAVGHLGRLASASE